MKEITMSLLPSVYIIIVYITFPTLQKAQEITKTLLEQRLIACATMVPSNSMFWWDGAIQNEVEYIVIAKTINDKYGDLIVKINELHPYDVPCILKINAQAELPYAQWVINEVNK
jgi:periplasmic divalent cation tolerance protein